MSTNIKFFAILISVVLLTGINTKQALAQHADLSFQIFYDQLSPYGQWVDYPDYGYVWLPDADQDFAPYSTNGYWIMTEYGMTWVSNYSWGWAPFHYGRWNYDDYFGWFWVPDNEWGPAWVTWRHSSGYYGWEPMRPGVSLTISFGSHYDNHYDHWIFVRDRDIDRHDIHRYYIGHHEHDRIIRNSTVINNTYIDNSRHVTYVSGPRRDDLHRQMGRDVRTASIHDYNTPGHDFRDNQLHIYRPQVNRNDNRNEHHAPSRVSNLEEIRKHKGNNTVNQNPTDNNNRNRQENINRTNNNNRITPGNNNHSNENRRNNQENVNRTNNNNNNTQNVNRNNDNNRNRNDVNRTENTNRNKRENINRTNENSRNSNENNNIQNRNSNNRANHPAGNRSENQNRTNSGNEKRRK